MEENEIEWIPIVMDDFDFGYNVKKTVFKEYIVKTWGDWNEGEQLSSYKNNFKLENNYLIKNKGTKIGWLSFKELHENININQIFILPEYQNKGIVTIIIDRIKNIGKKKNKNISLRVLKCNMKALKLYEKLKFVKYEETKTHYLLKTEEKWNVT